MAVRTKGARVTREDLHAAFSDLLGEGEATARAAAPQAIVVAGAVALALFTLAYVAGRRRGRRRTAVLEVRRI
ncbi:MAG TPA: hypothetical protein VMU76_09840 [Acidimicrobiales bacterium]|nr:hypothetical protein [Acidimicrobiales bacterium]